MMQTDTVTAHSPAPKSKKPVVAVPAPQEDKDIGYNITLHFNSKAQFEDINVPQDMNPLFTLEHLTLVCHWLTHELVEKGKEDKQ